MLTLFVTEAGIGRGIGEWSLGNRAVHELRYGAEARSLRADAVSEKKKITRVRESNQEYRVFCCVKEMHRWFGSDSVVEWLTSIEE